MTKQDFLEKLKTDLEIDSHLSLDTEFKQIEEWDSLTVLMLLAFIENNFHINLKAKDIEVLTDFNSLIKVIGEEKFN